MSITNPGNSGPTQHIPVSPDTPEITKPLHSPETAKGTSTMPVEGTRHFPEPVEDTTGEPETQATPQSSTTRELLNQTSDGRTVSLQTVEQDDQSIEESGSPTPLRQRSVKEESTKTWMDTLLPWRWGTKTTSERTVTKPERSGIKNWTIFFILNKLIAPFVKGLSTSNLTGGLQSLSACYHNTKNNTQADVKPIYLRNIYLPGPNITLQDVCITPKLVRPAGSGTGADRFKKIDIKADVSGKAVVWLGDTAQQATVNIQDVDLSAYFKNGSMLEKLLEKGTLYGNLTHALWNLSQMKDCLMPTQCTCHLNKGASVEVITPGFKEGASGVKIHTADLKLDFNPPANPQGKALTFKTSVENLDAEAHSSRMGLLVPDTLKPLMKQLFPHALMGNTCVKLQASCIDITKQEDGVQKTECKHVTLNTEGDIGLKNTQIPSVTLAKSPPDKPESALVIQCPELEGEVNIPQATFNLAHDICGPVHLEGTTVSLNSCQQEDASKKLESVEFTVNSAEGDLTGGIACEGMSAKNIQGKVNVEATETTITIDKAKAKTFSIGTAPDRVTPENRLISAGATIGKTKVFVRPDQPTDTTVVTVDVDTVQATQVEGLATAHSAQLENFHVTFQTGTPIPMHPSQDEPENPIQPKLTLRTGKVSANNLILPENITGQSVRAELTPRDVKNLCVECTLPRCTADREDQEAFHQSVARAVAPWQLPTTRVASAITTIKTDHIESDISIQLPGAVDPQESAPAPRSTGIMETGRSEIELEYHMRDGFKQANITVEDKTVIDMQHGDVTGKIEAAGLKGYVEGGVEYSSNEITTHTQAEHLACTNLTTSERFLPEGVKIETDVEITNPTLFIKTQPPEKHTNAITGEETYSSRPLQSEMDIEGSEWKTRVETKKDKVVSPETKKTLKAIADYLPEEYQAPTRPILMRLASTPEEASGDIIKQEVAFKSDNTTVKAEVKSNNDKTINLATGYTALTLPDGAVTGAAHLRDTEISASTSANHQDIQLEVEEMAIVGAQTNDTYQLPVQANLYGDNCLKGIKLTTRQSGNDVSTHGSVQKGKLTLEAGANGMITDNATFVKRPMEPLKINADIKRVEVNLQQDKHLTMTNAAVGGANLEITQTKDQLGTDLKASTAIHDALVVADSTGTGEYLDAEVGDLSFNVSGNLNGSVHAQKTGLSACRDLEGTKINPRFDGRRIKTSFPDASRELVNIFRSTKLQKSALGQVCDLKLSPDLDENMSGTLTLSAGGALSPLLALGLSRLGKKITRIALPVARLLTKVLRFHIYLDHLPMREGKTTLPEFMACLKISFSSDYGIASKAYASAIHKLVKLARGLFVGPLLKKVHLLDNKTNEIALTNLASMMGEQVQLLSRDQMPEAYLPGTGDALNDTRNMLQLNNTLPSNWTPTAFRHSLQQRMESMRWKNQPLKDVEWVNIPSLAQRIVDDLPLPKNMLEFHFIEDWLDTMQDVIWAAKSELSEDEILRQTLTKVPTMPMNMYSDFDETPHANVRVISAQQRGAVYQPFRADIVTHELERVERELSPWITEQSQKGHERPQSVFTTASKQTARLLNSKQWREAQNLSQSLQVAMPTHEYNQKLHKLRKLCRTINAAINSICKPVSPLGAQQFMIRATAASED